jgi:hypothetical protein
MKCINVCTYVRIPFWLEIEVPGFIGLARALFIIILPNMELYPCLSITALASLIPPSYYAGEICTIVLAPS